MEEELANQDPLVTSAATTVVVVPPEVRHHSKLDYVIVGFVRSSVQCSIYMLQIQAAAQVILIPLRCYFPLTVPAGKGGDH